MRWESEECNSMGEARMGSESHAHFGDGPLAARDYLLIREDNWPEVIPEPFPHVIIDNALPEEAFAELRRTMPADDYLAGPRLKGPNRYHRRSAAELLDDEAADLSDPWRTFLQQHLGRSFYQTCLSVFSGYLQRANETFRAVVGQGLDELEPAMRGGGDARDAEAWLECQISHVTPADATGSPLGPHVDREVALWAGLFYLRGVGNEQGADLVFYRFRDPRKREYWKDRMIPPSLVEPIKTIEARENRLVLFLHGPDAVHGVTPRRPGQTPRQSVNLVCEAPFKVWDIAPWQTKPDVFPTPTD